MLLVKKYLKKLLFRYLGGLLSIEISNLFYTDEKKKAGDGLIYLCAYQVGHLFGTRYLYKNFIFFIKQSFCKKVYKF